MGKSQRVPAGLLMMDGIDEILSLLDQAAQNNKKAILKSYHSPASSNYYLSITTM
jgi:hypothetical protein